MNDADDLRSRYEAAGQGHVFRFWSRLDAAGRGRLVAQLRSISLEWVKAAAEDLRRGKRGFHGDLLPADYIPLAQCPADAERDRCARAVGEDLIRKGKVAALMVAGGQGTRLGSDSPKGCFPIMPVSGGSLYQIHAESVLAVGRRYGAAIPLCVMTSEATDAATRAFFDRHGRFGLRHEDLRIFVQGMLPALTPDGRLAMTAPDQVLMSPNGHGGVLAALCDQGVLDFLEARGVEEVSYFQADNPLIAQVDPLFLGHHRLAGAQMSSKAIPKRDPAEKLGAFGRVGGRLWVVEYSDLAPEQASRRRPDGSLVFGLGSPAMHVLNVAFVRRLTAQGPNLPLHVAEKAAALVDDQGRIAPAAGGNVRKFEMFVFDALPFAERSVIMEVRREDEFSPVKNAQGEDSPDTARRDMMDRWARWLQAAGAVVPRDESGRPKARIEISPLAALDADDLRSRVRPGTRIEGVFHLSA